METCPSRSRSTTLRAKSEWRAAPIWVGNMWMETDASIRDPGGVSSGGDDSGGIRNPARRNYLWQGFGFAGGLGQRANAGGMPRGTARRAGWLAAPAPGR